MKEPECGKKRLLDILSITELSIVFVQKKFQSRNKNQNTLREHFQGNRHLDRNRS